MTQPPAILLTGASGYIGREVLQRLLARGERVIALYGSTPPGQAGHPLCEAVQLDLAAASAADALAGLAFTRVIHLVGLSRAAPARMQAINVTGMRHVLAAARRQGVTHFVHVSTIDAVGGVATAYGASKHEAELLLQASSLPHTIARPGLVYGNGGGALAQVTGFARRWHLYPRPGSGRQRYQPVQVGDLADWLVQQVAQAPVNAVIPVAGSVALTQCEIFAAALRQAGVKALPVPLPVPCLAGARALLGFCPLANEYAGKLLLNAHDRLLLDGGVVLPKGFPDGL